jgi:hypothetical protein
MVLDNIYLIYISKGYKYNNFPDNNSTTLENTTLHEIESPLTIKSDSIQNES